MNPGLRVSEYCERIDASFWAEPANAVSNIAFIATAIGIFWLLPRKGPRDYPVLLLIALTVLMGIGSFLYHTTPSRLTAIADVLPIGLFIYASFFIAIMRFLALRLITTIWVTAAFIAVSLAVSMSLQHVIGTSAGYAPALLALFGVGLVTLPYRRKIGTGMIMTGLMFTLSLSLRTMDYAVCDWFPIGTHFMWHALNSVVAYMLLRLIVHARRPGTFEH
ncbi:ceramidase [Breoghania corrubedonensis]|uniref:Ceramidase n=1 Tax=Breoghania corrubedonensis TaxID=665038 RepID=A0A2T5VEP4_9HYPH|nr:ceramidase domain-containing protein [Breoghania corrubedonensis]PTW62217.1 ceramidase [Breoghania corrubedonensis]